MFPSPIYPPPTHPRSTEIWIQLHRNLDSNTPPKDNDKRTPQTLRPIHMTTHILSQSQGSCLFELGHTKILVGVIGPRSLPASTNPSTANVTDGSDGGELQCHVQYAPHFGKGTMGSTLPVGRSLVERFRGRFQWDDP